MLKDSQIEADEILRRLEGGMTRPFLCRATNGRLYVAKGLELPPRQRIAELVCARLATALGLPISEYGIIYVDSSLVRYSAEFKSELGAGDSFTLAFLEAASDLMPSQIASIPPALQQAIYVFDFWIGNGDRQLSQYGGRSNLMLSEDGQHLNLIDHNLAFTWPVDAGDFAASHVFGPDNRRWKLDLVAKAGHEADMQAVSERLDELCSGIPQEWQEAMGDLETENFLRYIKENLLRCNKEGFWGSLI